MTPPDGPENAAESRRDFLNALGNGVLRTTILLHSGGSLLRASERGGVISSSVTPYLDAATDLPVLRLTDPTSTSLLPPSSARALASNGESLLLASDVSGSMQAYRMGIRKPAKRGETPRVESQQWTETSRLEPEGLTLLPGDRSFLYAADGALWSSRFSSAKPAVVYRFPEGFGVGRGISVSSDGLYAVFIERRTVPSPRYRLRLLHLRNNSSTVLADTEDELDSPMVRPRRASVLYRRAGSVYLANLDGQQNYRLKIADEAVRAAAWAGDGRTVLYLQASGDPSRPVGIREFTPDTNSDRAVADTTQFAGFSLNADASVFVGASGSLASPYILLLVRAVRRELTLCEHRASDPAMVAPVFSRNSQHVFFTSDLHGKPAIYRVDVDRLVEETRAESVSGR